MSSKLGNFTGKITGNVCGFCPSSRFFDEFCSSQTEQKLGRSVLPAKEMFGYLVLLTSWTPTSCPPLSVRWREKESRSQRTQSREETARRRRPDE